MDYEQLITNVDEVRQAARAAAAVYLKRYAGSSPSGAAAQIASGEHGSLLDDAKVRAVLESALRRPDLFSHPPEEVYDLAGNVLFRDFAFDLGDGVEARVRTGANKALGAAIVSLSIARAWDRDAAIEAALARGRERGLGAPRQPIRAVCYGYPRLGIVFETASGQARVVDLMTREDYDLAPDAAWSPLGSLSPAAAEDGARRFGEEAAALAAAAATPEVLSGEATAQEPEHRIPLQLVVQERQNYCAPASSAMILQHFGVAIDQFGVAEGFAVAVGGDAANNLRKMKLSGTVPDWQKRGLASLCRRIGLAPELVLFTDIQDNWNAKLPQILDELAHDRPVQRQMKMPSHVDVIAGWQGVAGSNDLMLWLYDPVQPNGDVKLDRWDALSKNINHVIFMRPAAA